MIHHRPPRRPCGSVSRRGADYPVKSGQEPLTGRRRCRQSSAVTSPDPFGIDLYWLPLGAGGNFVRLNGRVYEAISAAILRRPKCDLYHSALIVSVPDGRYTIEQTPAQPHGEKRGVVGIGPIGARWLSRVHRFRYELRRWRDGVIPDVSEAVDSPRRLSSDPARARRLLAVVAEVPFLVWGRDELGVGEMWNSNSQIAWLLARSGFDLDSITPPAGGRAPGWNAGVVAAARNLAWRPESSSDIAMGNVTSPIAADWGDGLETAAASVHSMPLTTRSSR